MSCLISNHQSHHAAPLNSVVSIRTAERTGSIHFRHRSEC